MSIIKSLKTSIENGKPRVTFRPEQEATRLDIIKSIVIEKGYDIMTPDFSLIDDFSDCFLIPEDDKKYKL